MRRHGFTLVETMLVIVIMGIVLAMAIPRLRDSSLKRSVRGSRNTLQGVYAQARILAIQQARSTGVRFSGTNVFITGYPRADGAAGYDTIGTVRDLAKEFGVTVTSTVNPISISSKGFTRGTDEIKVKVAKDSYTDSLLISPYGRIRK